MSSCTLGTSCVGRATLARLVAEAVALVALGHGILLAQGDPRPADIQFKVVVLNGLEGSGLGLNDENGVAVCGLPSGDNVKVTLIEGISCGEVLLDVLADVIFALEEHRQCRVTLGERLNRKMLGVLVLDFVGEHFNLLLATAQNRDATTAN